MPLSPTDLFVIENLVNVRKLLCTYIDEALSTKKGETVVPGQEKAVEIHIGKDQADLLSTDTVIDAIVDLYIDAGWDDVEFDEDSKVLTLYYTNQ